MKLFASISLTLASCVVAVSHGSDALACGGCFHGVNEVNPSVVTGHRMALSISQSRTVLWDQVEYAGDPKEFAWVLPVGENAYIEEADDAFFEALEAVSATRVMSRAITCNGQQIQQAMSSGGCGASTPIDTIEPRGTDATTEQQGMVRGVTVVHEGTVGPYETATIKSNDPQALRTWLTTNGYAIPADIESVIDGYVAEGASFIALRLQPGFGVRQMTPIRVITPGASPILPLRMVAAGTGTATSIVLYVLGEGRYRAAMRPHSLILPQDVTWDWAAFQSDYATLRANSFVDDAFLTSFAHSGGLTAPVTTTDGSNAEYDVVYPTGTVGTYDNLVDLYFGQAGANDGLPIECGNVRDSLALAAAGAQVAAPCDAADPMCMPPTNSISAANLECEGHRDIAVALEGMHPRDVWVTRLEANLSRKALGQDLIVEADAQQTPVTNWMIAGKDANLPPCNPPSAAPTPAVQASPGVGCGCTTPQSRSFDPAAALIALLALIHSAKQIRRRE
jgi:Uncharacterized protein conserved in bacteria (DUF2330)